MKARHLTAIGVVAAAGLWIASGHLLPHEKAESRAAKSEPKPLFRVAVVGTSLVPHRRNLTIAGRTEAALAAAEAERDRGVVRAPWSGIVHDVAVEVGQAAFSFAGREIATIVALDPMLAVVEVAERKLAGIRVGDTAQVRLVTGESV